MTLYFTATLYIQSTPNVAGKVSSYKITVRRQLYHEDSLKNILVPGNSSQGFQSPLQQNI